MKPLSYFVCALLLFAASASATAQTPGPSGPDGDAPYINPYSDPYASPAPAPRPSPLISQRLELGAPGHRYPFPIYASLPLDAPAGLRKVKRLVIVVHDERRDAERSLRDITALYAGQTRVAADTLVVAPRFPSMVDAALRGMPAWHRTGWMEGLPSIAVRGRPLPRSSFLILDDLLRHFTAPDRLPSLQTIVLAGHGAGAQMVQRYAVLNPLDESLRATGLGISYLVANAESYLYLSPLRPSRTGRGYARYERGICPTYEHYRYGLEDMPAVLQAYDGRLGRAQLASRYALRHVTYLLGSADNNPEYRGLDKSCGAEAEGATPLARGLGYWGYEMRGHGRNAPKPARHGFTVEGIGHNEAGMYASACAAKALLGSGDWATSATCKALPAQPRG
ncbi:hypothetical protein [Bordetella sp. FB-8]|uniref:hypothetical protein n=1 Tax=Bordetella sp. FB-8 TaxID=1159870 RepID=UPI0003788D05|nr:hypothetical protein [Bordetella sp. FB-8]